MILFTSQDHINFWISTNLNMLPVHINNSKHVSFLVNHRYIIMLTHQVLSNVTANRVFLLCFVFNELSSCLLCFCCLLPSYLFYLISSKHRFMLFIMMGYCLSLSSLKDDQPFHHDGLFIVFHCPEILSQTLSWDIITNWSRLN